MKPVASELANQRVARVEGLAEVVSSVIGRIEDYAEPFEIGPWPTIHPFSHRSENHILELSALTELTPAQPRALVSSVS
jgi:hypothetical protein